MNNGSSIKSRISLWNQRSSQQHVIPQAVTFEQLVPPEVIFLIFSYLDFRYLFKTIPFVCSEWRQLVIERIDTLHIYPNIENYLEESENCSNVVDTNVIQYNEMMVEKDIIPFIKYITKFVESNEMKISHLFFNGGISNVFKKRHYIDQPTFYKLCNSSPSVFKSPKDLNREELLNAMKIEAGRECCFTNAYTMPYADTVNVPEYAVEGLSENVIIYSDNDSPALCELIRVVSPYLKTLVLSHCILKQRFLDSVFVRLRTGLKVLVLENITRKGDVFNKILVRYLQSTVSNIPNVYEQNTFQVVRTNSYIDGHMLGSARKASIRTDSSTIKDLSESLKRYQGEKKTESLELRIGSEEYSYWDSDWVSNTSIGMTSDQLYSIVDSLKKLKSLTIAFETTLDELIYLKPDVHFLPTSTLDLPLLEELRLQGRSFLSHRFDELISIPSLKLLSCQVTSREDVEKLKSLLRNSENIEQLEIQLVASKSKDFEISLLEAVTSLVFENTKLRNLLLRNLSMDRMEHLVQMMKTISSTDKYINLGVQFKGPYEFPLGTVVEHLKQQSPPNVHIVVLNSMPQLITQSPTREKKNTPEQQHNQATVISLDNIRSKRKKFSTALQKSNVSCVFCGMVVKRDAFDTHCHLYHTKGDINYLSHLAKKVDLHNYDIECSSCQATVARKDWENHLNSSCTKEKVRLLMANFEDKQASQQE